VAGEKLLKRVIKISRRVKDEEGWKMMLEGFMAPWNLGQTIVEAKTRIREYGSMGFGLSAHQ
jgi:hypothetical protein